MPYFGFYAAYIGNSYTEVSGKPIGPFFYGQEILEEYKCH
jgi:hypothetical protein